MKAFLKHLNNKQLDYALRLFVAINMFKYASAKIFKTQFSYNDISLSKPVKELSGFDLTWIYFGHSFAYTCLIAILQIAGGLLLIYNRTRLIGALVLVPILFNIILIDIFYQIPRGALSIAITILICLFVIIYNNRIALLNLILDSGKIFQRPISIKAGLINIGIILILYEGLWVFQMFINFIVDRF